MDRLDVKEGDEEIARERERQLLARTPLPIGHQRTHILHPQHPLTFNNGVDYVCDSCHKPSNGTRYSCRACNSDLHLACAVSKEWFDSLNETETGLQTFAHEHQLSLVTGKSEFTCTHCLGDGFTRYRYQCVSAANGGKCYDQVDLICAKNPTMVESFMHPNHLLELKTQHHFQKCGVCNHSGKLNARVYTCEKCEFFVHPSCAQCPQYLQDHPLHPCEGHTLVYWELPKKQKPICKACGKKCKYWRYTCGICTTGADFHRKCIVNYYTNKNGSSWREAVKEGLSQVGEEFATEIGMEFALQALAAMFFS